jgi:hypothetical protein
VPTPEVAVAKARPGYLLRGALMIGYSKCGSRFRKARREMTEQEKKEIEELIQYVNALTLLVAGTMAVLDEKIPDFRNELKSAIQRQHGHDPTLKDEIQLSTLIIDGLRHVVRN